MQDDHTLLDLQRLYSLISFFGSGLFVWYLMSAFTHWYLSLLNFISFRNINSGTKHLSLDLKPGLNDICCLDKFHLVFPWIIAFYSSLLPLEICWLSSIVSITPLTEYRQEVQIFWWGPLQGQVWWWGQVWWLQGLWQVLLGQVQGGEEVTPGRSES